MRSIYFDLETSDSAPIGQILNFCFILVDENFAVLEECSGTVALTPLQAPSLGALLANRIRILDHQAQFTEREAALHIDEFLSRVTEAGKVALIGYNSFRFDVPFLRTVLIRNGLNPYYQGAIVYRDIYAAVQFLACVHPNFTIPRDADGRGTLSLEAVTKSFGLLTGKQSHESRDDVLLEIALAQYLGKHFKLNVANWDSYQAKIAHEAPRGEIFTQLVPNREPHDPVTSAEIVNVKRIPLMLIDVDHRNSLWLDLAKYREKTVKFVTGKVAGGSFFIEPFKATNATEHDSLRAVAAAALEEHREIKLATYWQKSECDIEQDIYRIDFNGIDRLHRAIYDDDERAVKDAKIKDLTSLWVRAKLATGNALTPNYTEILQKYAQYRYGGEQMLLSRFKSEVPLRYAASREELLEAVAKPQEDAEDEEIRRQLAEFYRTAPVLKW